MNRQAFEKLVFEKYGVKPDYPWKKDRESAVFRHDNNKKWFALIMHIPKKRLIPNADGFFSVVNFKCDPVLTGFYLNKPGFFAAYHMNKEKWLTAALDDTAPDADIELLLEFSFNLTENKLKRLKK